MSNLQIFSLVLAIGIVALLLRFADKWVESKLPLDIEDRLSEADEEVANRTRLGDL